MPIQIRTESGQENANIYIYIYTKEIELSSFDVISLTIAKPADLTTMKCSTLTETRPIRILSIECLPTEILEIIFFDCLNLSLPRASLTLGCILSSFYVKSRLFEMVFSGTKDTHADAREQLSHEEELAHIFGLSSSHREHFYSFSPLECEVGNFQSELLKLRWVKADFFRQYVPRYLEKMTCAFDQDKVSPVWVHKSPLKHRVVVRSWTPEERVCLVSQNVDRREVFVRLYRKEIDLSNVVAHIKENKTTRIHILDQNRDYVHGSQFEDEEHIISKKPRRMVLHCLGCYIPSKLLGGPWTKDRYHLLKMFTLAGARLNRKNRTDLEIATRGFFEALKNRNVHVIRLLLELNLYVGPEYLFWAVIYLDCPKAIIYSMIRRHRHQWRGVHVDELRARAKYAIEEKGCKRGSWLLNYLRRYPSEWIPDDEYWYYIFLEDPNSSPGTFELDEPKPMEWRIYPPVWRLCPSCDSLQEENFPSISYDVMEYNGGSCELCAHPLKSY